ncbi:MAG TPA: redoxin domain-containing protein [Dokdonella sp.]|nr:redoxin domain-containing protein [Dokdonella sp.]
MEPTPATTPPFSTAHAFTREACIAALSLCLVFVAAPACAEGGEDFAREAGAAQVGRFAPPVRLTTIDGDTIDLGALRGRKAVYPKFWATWCSPCRAQMPHFERVRQAAGDDLAVVAINLGFDDTLEQVRAFRDEFGLTMPVVRDEDGRLAGLFGVRVTPQHVIIDRDGVIRHVGHLADVRVDAALVDARRRRAGIAAAPARSTAPAPPRAGDVPATQVRTLAGEEVALADPERRRRSVLAFVSPWCEDYFARMRPESSARCRSLREQLAEFGDDARVRWLGVASGLWASEADLGEWRDRSHVAIPLVLDRDGALFRRFGVTRVPLVVVLDANGRVERRIEFEHDGLRAALGEPRAP